MLFRSQSSERYNYKNADYDSLKKSVEENDLVTQIRDKNAQEAWDCILGTVKAAVDKCVPKCKTGKTTKRRTPVWWNDKAMRKIRRKKEAYQRYLQTRDGKDFLEYTKARNQAKGACRQAIRNHEKNVAREAKINPKAFFAYAKSKTKVSEGIGDLLDDHGYRVSDDKGKADILNSFFCNVFTRERTDNIPEAEKKDVGYFLSEVSFSKETVLKKLKNLNPSKSPGPDGLHPCVLKELADQLAEPLAILYEKSLSEGKLPSVWKDANVTPLFKKGEKCKAGNYRPVSLTCVLCKLMESIIRDSLVEYLEEEELLSRHQHGFISKRSCTSNLLATMDKWTEYLDTGIPVDAIYLDFSKAFDSVPHLRLLEKLESYGVNSFVLEWIRDFLIGRRQRVRVKDSFSEWSPVASGVPQGSCLGPVLFVVYINDLPNVVQSLCELYADDTKVFSRVDKDEPITQLQSDLDSLVAWADTWQLRFNADKCHVLHLGHNNPHHMYCMKKHDSDDVVSLEASEVEKDLGVLVDNKLKFSGHIQGQVNKANRLVGLIRRSYTFLDKDSFKMLFVALVRPHLEFGNVAWSPGQRGDKNLIESVLRRASKNVPCLKELTYEQRLKKLNLPSMEYRRIRGDLIEVYKYTHGFYSVNQDLLQLDTSGVTRGHQFKLYKQRCSLSLRQNFFTFRVVDRWNALPSSVVDSPSLQAFKNGLDWIMADNKFATRLE